jgi:predicted transcriptional regulator
MKPVTFNLPDEQSAWLGEVSRASERSKSFIIRKLIERAQTGDQRLEALSQIAAAGLAESSSDLTRDAFDKFSTRKST